MSETYETVDVIASGYEWECPSEYCGRLNNEIEITETVKCRNCNITYETNPAEHASE